MDFYGKILANKADGTGESEPRKIYLPDKFRMFESKIMFPVFKRSSLRYEVIAK